MLRGEGGGLHGGQAVLTAVPRFLAMSRSASGLILDSNPRDGTGRRFLPSFRVRQSQLSTQSGSYVDRAGYGREWRWFLTAAEIARPVRS